MPRIHPAVLKELRLSRGWTQTMLAERTKAPGLPQIDKQTIWRLEHGACEFTRRRTIEQIAWTLKVDTAVLTGDLPLSAGNRLRPKHVLLPCSRHPQGLSRSRSPRTPPP